MISYWKGLGQFIKFNVVGIMNTAVDFGVFMILNRFQKAGDLCCLSRCNDCSRFERSREFLYG